MESIVDEMAKEKKRVTVETFFRTTFKGILDTIGAYLNKLGIKPNTVTISGLVGNFIGAGLLATGHITAGGIVVFLMGPIDALDGTMARLRGESTSFGGFVDSVTDRYSELVILLGLLIYFLQLQNEWACLLIYLAASGSVLVSYVKARAEGVGYSAKVGFLSRLERYLVLAPALVIGNQYVIMVALAIIAFFANLTALQRIFFVRRQAYEQWAKNKDKSSLP
jgi:CDP-diacylglycerol---glycerol-3-phosphate 3-phosphatidyltransferase